MRMKKSVQANGLNIQELTDGTWRASFNGLRDVRRFFGSDQGEAISRARRFMMERRKAEPIIPIYW